MNLGCILLQMDLSYLGANVNVSMRLEELTKTYGRTPRGTRSHVTKAAPPKYSVLWSNRHAQAHPSTNPCAGCWLLMTHHFHRYLCPALQSCCQPVDRVLMHVRQHARTLVVGSDGWVRGNMCVRANVQLMFVLDRHDGASDTVHVRGPGRRGRIVRGCKALVISCPDTYDF